MGAINITACVSESTQLTLSEELLKDWLFRRKALSDCGIEASALYKRHELPRYSF